MNDDLLYTAEQVRAVRDAAIAAERERVAQLLAPTTALVREILQATGIQDLFSYRRTVELALRNRAEAIRETPKG